MLNKENISTTHLLNLMFETAKEVKKDPYQLLKETCEEYQINFPKRVILKVVSYKNFERIKKGNELIFDIFQRELIDNKIYCFVYEDKDILYEDFGRYNAKNKSFKVCDEIYYPLNNNFQILGQLIEISVDL